MMMRWNAWVWWMTWSPNDWSPMSSCAPCQRFILEGGLWKKVRINVVFWFLFYVWNDLCVWYRLSSSLTIIIVVVIIFVQTSYFYLLYICCFFFIIWCSVQFVFGLTIITNLTGMVLWFVTRILSMVYIRPLCIPGMSALLGRQGFNCWKQVRCSHLCLWQGAFPLCNVYIVFFSRGILQDWWLYIIYELIHRNNAAQQNTWTGSSNNDQYTVWKKQIVELGMMYVPTRASCSLRKNIFKKMVYKDVLLPEHHTVSHLRGFTVAKCGGTATGFVWHTKTLVIHRTCLDWSKNVWCVASVLHMNICESAYHFYTVDEYWILMNMQIWHIYTYNLQLRDPCCVQVLEAMQMRGHEFHGGLWCCVQGTMSTTQLRWFAALLWPPWKCRMLQKTWNLNRENPRGHQAKQHEMLGTNDCIFQNAQQTSWERQEG